MKHVLVTVSGGIIEDVRFFDDPGKAVRALSDFVRAMNVSTTMRRFTMKMGWWRRSGHRSRG